MTSTGRVASAGLRLERPNAVRRAPWFLAVANVIVPPDLDGAGHMRDGIGCLVVHEVGLRFDDDTLLSDGFRRRGVACHGSDVRAAPRHVTATGAAA